MGATEDRREEAGKSKDDSVGLGHGEHTRSKEVSRRAGVNSIAAVISKSKLR